MTDRKSSCSKYIVAALMVLIALPAFARVPVRPTSDNGAGSDVDNWMLLGKSIVINLGANGKTVKATREIVCANPQTRLKEPASMPMAAEIICTCSKSNQPRPMCRSSLESWWAS